MSRFMAGCAGLFLLLPGLCFLVTGVARGYHTLDVTTIEFFLTGVGILGGAGYLIYLGFRAPEVTLDDSPNAAKIKRPTEQEPPTKPEPPTTE